MEYKTTHKGTKIEYYYDEGKVAIHRNGEFWGVPQGKRFMIALLDDIKKLQKKIEEQQKDINFFLKKQEANKEITQELVALNDPRVVAILTKARTF